MSIKAIFLDFYGTIVHEDAETMSQICEEIKENANIEASVLDIGGYWMKAFKDLLIICQGEEYLKQRELITSSLSITLAHFQSNENAEKLLEPMFHHWKNPTIFPDAVQFLWNNTIPVYILSNIDQLDIMEAINVLELNVAGVITSENVKAYKPHRAIFEYALGLAGLTSDKVLHVGDSLSNDVAGANQVGINSVWINRNKKQSPTENGPTYVIENLNEILKITGQ